jgi:hypothetical protein
VPRRPTNRDDKHHDEREKNKYFFEFHARILAETQHHELRGHVLQRDGSTGLMAKNIVNKDDPRLPLTAAQFLAKSWKLANKKARELAWIV